MATKEEIRRRTSIFRHETETEMIKFASEIIGYKLLSMDQYKEAEAVYIYADYNKEVETTLIIEDALKSGKKVALPKMYKTLAAEDENNSLYMKFHYIKSLDDLEPGYKGIREPKETCEEADDFTGKSIMVMPVVGFDADRNRVGYGGGNYDKYLCNHKFKKTIGLAFDEQKVDEIDGITKEDIKHDIILTQRVLYL